MRMAFACVMIRRLFKLSAFCAAGVSLSACGSIKKIVPDIHVPVPDVTKLLPGSEDKAAADDPDVAFNSRGVLGYGHSLRVRVYEGARKGDKIYEGVVMVDQQGVAKFGKFGSAKLGGRSLAQAAKLIESTFRVGGHAASQIHVHIGLVENVRLVAVDGDVRLPQFLPMWDGMRFSDAVNVAGGRKPGSQGRAVYLTREGMKRFFRWIVALDEFGSPEAGDIITLSPDL